MLQGEHSAILLTFIKLPFVIKTFVLSIVKVQFKIGFTVVCACVESLFSSLAIMLLRKRELVSLPYLCCGCVLCLFLMMP